MRYVTTTLRRIWRALQSPRLLFFILAYFMILLIIGTLAQKELGVFKATHLFFNSFFYWLGPFPIPVGASVLAMLFINLAAHFMARSTWGRQQLGVTLAHFSVLILLLGGGVTLFTKIEGFIILRQNDTVQAIYDYHDRELQILHNGKMILAVPHRELHKGMSIHHMLPFQLSIQETCDNCVLSEDHHLLPATQNLDDETKQFGMSFSIDTGTSKKHNFTTTEFDTKPIELSIGREKYQFVLQRKKYILPFSLLLDDFSQSYYPNTDIAKGFSSALSITENKRAWPVLVSMNNPFRYKGYTFYQSSVMQLPNGETASVLNVVKNSGWLFPYIATGLLFAGLSLHAWGRYGRR